MTDQSSDTKIKIMDAARILFADKGYEGTSIREIAKAAEVNVASLNYHFSSKEKLFAGILEKGRQQTSEAIKDFYENQSASLEETLVFLFRYFNSTSHDLISFFKMLMSTQLKHVFCTYNKEEEMIGPPGGEIIMKAIIKEVSREVSKEELFWAVRTLFGHVVHNTIINNCVFKGADEPFSSEADIEIGIRKLTRSVLRELKG